MKIIPNGYRVAITEDNPDEMTKGGILIPKSGQEAPATGVVVAVGSGEFDKNGVHHVPPVVVGDKVIFQRGCGDVYEVDGQDVRILSCSHIIATLVE